MGVAAYNRGSDLISRQLRADRREVAFEIMDRLNKLTKLSGAPKPFGPVTFVQSHGGWWISCPKTGFGYHYPSLTDAVQNWDVEITSCVIDSNGVTWEGVPR